MSLTKAPCCGLEHICHVDDVNELKSRVLNAQVKVREFVKDLEENGAMWRGPLVNQREIVRSRIREIREALS
jgi:hypothetical protein